MDETTVLVCDDDREIVEAIDIYLRQEGYRVLKAYDGEEAIRLLGENKVELLLIDVMMPKLDGIRATLKIRETSSVPIIILSAKSEDVDKILGLNIGADDYITKPFNPLELVARVKTQLRRYERYNHPLPSDVQSSSAAEPERDSRIDIRGLTIDRDSHKCSLNGSTLSLTPREFSILWYLCENKGRVISSEELFEQVWGEKFLDNNNTVMAHIGRLREKMKDSGRRPKYIKTVWGVGYQIE